MDVNVEMPFVGEAIERMRIVRWLRAVGDEVAAEEQLVEVTTDKIDFVIEAPASGTLVEIRAADGEVVKPYDVVAVIKPR